jgi:hypothetical protein
VVVGRGAGRVAPPGQLRGPGRQAPRISPAAILRPLRGAGG